MHEQTNKWAIYVLKISKILFTFINKIYITTFRIESKVVEVSNTKCRFFIFENVSWFKK